ncbi:MAG: hypothetical protein AB8B91_24530 [Rubripirellula sp.]
MPNPGAAFARFCGPGLIGYNSIMNLNPYAPTIHSDSDEPVAEELTPVRSSLLATFGRWSLVCTLSATPSFFLGLSITGGQVFGMLIGICLFILGYTALDYQTALSSVRQKKSVRRTLRITYGTRIVITVLFPIAVYLDMICGLISVGITSELSGIDLSSNSNEMGFLASLITTIVQGIVMNVVLGVYGIVVHLIQLTIMLLNGSANRKDTQQTVT